MRSAVTVLAAALTATAGPVLAEAASGYSLPMTSSYSQRELLKNWSLSACLALVAKDKRTGQDASDTASAYFEFGKLPPEAYEELEALAKTYADRRYSGTIPSEFNTMKCIDLYHSKELNRLATRLLRKQVGN